jgi:LAS superfamily LD-carboxypeptidase LdcB
MNELELTGRARTHVIEIETPRCALHYEVVGSFMAMREAARSRGVDLRAASSFRNFDHQVAIWNRKWRGERILYGRDGRPVAHEAMSEPELVDAILCWSAIPGGSRHHWGTDVDVIDASAMPPGYEVQLLPAEYAADGVFRRLTAWLDENMHRFGFYRPYGSDRGGAGVEPWHLSYAPVASEAMEALSLSVLRAAVAASAMEGKQAVLDRLPEIYTRFILAVDPPALPARRGATVRA